MDTDLRTLERAAATGDASAVRALARLREAVVDEQDHALARLHSGRSVFLTGPAGCIDGEAEIRYSRATLGRKILLKDLYLKFNGMPTAAGRRWNPSIPTYVRSLVDGVFRLNLIRAVLDQGVKPVVKVTLASGKTLRATPDHEVCVGVEKFLRADALKVGDEVLTNGKPVTVEACTLCRGTDRVSLVVRHGRRQNKYPGLCRPCIDKILCERSAPTAPSVDKRGYLMWAVPGHPSKPFSQKRVFEHRLVVEASMNSVTLGEWLRLGRTKGGYPEGSKFLTRDQVVHHRNGDVKDNRLENLEITTPSEHAAEHGRDRGFLRMNGGTAGTGGKIQFVPKVDLVVSVTPDGEAHVYDIVCADPWRNFVANGIVVHNCGKSHVLRRWLKDCETSGRRVAVTASTGAAALQIGGTTLHRAVGLGVDMGWERSARREGWRFQAQELRDLDALVVDEISMVDGKTLTDAAALCELARSGRGYYDDAGSDRAPHPAAKPWGGLQVVFVGDLGQLPPVEASTRGFCFEGEGWERLDPEIVELRRVRRQEDKAFAELLGRLRLGHLSRADLQVLADRVQAFDPNTGLRLAPRRVDVDAANEAALAAIPGEAVELPAVDSGTEAALAQLDRDCMAPKLLRLKVGARVIAVQNEQGMLWANGSQGTVASFERGGVHVAFDRGGVHWVGPSLFPLRERKNGTVVVRAHREQVPLRLGYAVTIHKSQGMSLDRASVNLDGSFERGLAYVALSRVRSLAGLNLESRRMGSLEAHPKFLRFVRERGLS